MGCMQSKTKEQIEAEKRDQEIQRMAERDEQEEAQKIKLLLLGAGESGKSTIFKQMRILYGTSFSDQDRANHVGFVCSNTIASMKALIEAAENFDIQIKAQDAAEAIKDLSEETKIDKETAEQIKTLWNDPGIQSAYERRNEFQLYDSAPYFFRKVDEISDPDYIPSIEDVLKVRVRTSGIVEEEYLIDDVKFAMYDVGGQRNERKKWIHCFDEVTAVIFVAAINEYDQVLYEDSTQNRLIEALNLFHDICNSKWFENTSMILFLNKRDLFKDKIERVDIRQPDPADPNKMLFDDYTGGCDYDAGINYILQKFLDQNENKNNNKEIFWHVTCATDTDNVKTVFNACKEIILKQNLRGSGFMDDDDD